MGRGPLTEFRNWLCVPELVLVLAGLINVLGWALAGAQKLHGPLDIL